MKEVDDTPVTESESVLTDEEIQQTVRFLLKRVESIDRWIQSRIDYQREIPKEEVHNMFVMKSVSRLMKQVANLETQRTPQDENDDPEWY